MKEIVVATVCLLACIGSLFLQSAFGVLFFAGMAVAFVIVAASKLRRS